MTRWCSTRSMPITIRRAIWVCCGTIRTSAFAWPVTAETAILIDKDKKHPRLRDLPRHFAWTEKA